MNIQCFPTIGTTFAYLLSLHGTDCDGMFIYDPQENRERTRWLKNQKGVEMEWLK